jgi:hypothetical protein
MLFSMPSNLARNLEHLEQAAAGRGLNRGRWAARAGLPAATLSRLFKRDDCDLRTLERLARAAGQRLLLVPEEARAMPTRWDREAERSCVLLCASGSTDVARWMRAGPGYFMAGLATMMASARGADREAYLCLARALFPAMSDAAEFGEWLRLSPAKPSRFLPMVRALRGMAE